MDMNTMDSAYYPAEAPKRTFTKNDAKRAALTPQIRVTYSRPVKKGRTVLENF
jgi:hypothetical protein